MQIAEHDKKYLIYIDTQIPYGQVRDFDNDWAPVGPDIRKYLLKLDLILEEPSGAMIIRNSVREQLISEGLLCL